MLYNIEYKGIFYHFDDILCRLSELKYLKAFQKGYIYMKRLGEYIKSDNSSENAKYDYMEGAINDIGKWTYQNANGKIEFNIAHVCANWPVLCCSEVVPTFTSNKNENNLNVIINSKMKSPEFTNGNNNDMGIIFFSKNDFISSFELKLKAMNLSYVHGQVKYCERNPLLNKDIPKKSIEAVPYAFYKRIAYSYQNEYRFIIDKELIDGQRFYDFWIPDFSNNSFIIPLNEIQG